MANRGKRLNSVRNKSRKKLGRNLLKNFNSKIKRMSNKVKRINRNLSHRKNKYKRGRSNRAKYNRRQRRNSTRRRRNMKGGTLEFAPLPCDAQGATNWDSTKQVGHETCVEYGTDGAEKDARFGTRQSLSEMSITETIKDTVDEKLAELASKMVADQLNTAQVRDLLQAQSNSDGGAQGITSPVAPIANTSAALYAESVAADRISNQVYQDQQAAAQAAAQQAAAQTTQS